MNCYEGNSWDSQFCPDPATCSKNCAVDGVDQNDLGGTYGIHAVGSDGVSLKLVTQGPYSRNVGSRLYLLDSSGQKYKKLQLLNKEFTFTVKASDLDCGLNGALYLVEMDADGGMSYPGIFERELALLVALQGEIIWKRCSATSGGHVH